MSRPTLISPYGYTSSTCGYCTPSGSRSERETSVKYAFEGPQMSVQFYQDLIDRGWRRSGDFVYQPDMARTCCPQCTIRMNATQFKPNRKQRQVVNRWNRFLETGSHGEGSGSVQATSDVGNDANGADRGNEKTNAKGKGKAKEPLSRVPGKKGSNGEYVWMEELHRYETVLGSDKRAEGSSVRFETELVPAKSTTETFALYKRYQIAVHRDPPGKVTENGFRRFLCDSPLIDQPIPYPSPNSSSDLPPKYGSYHLLFKIDNRIIGFSVIDILPSCVSSVYFIWDPDWAWASLGKLSAIWEASLARRIEEGVARGQGGWVYMGYWIANCHKMRYKSEYSPSFLLDPGTHIFHPLTSTLDAYLSAHPRGYHPFANITGDASATSVAKEDEGDNEITESDDSYGTLPFPSPPPPGMLDPSTILASTVERALVLVGGARGQLCSVADLQFRNEAKVKQLIREVIAALGPDLVASTGKEMAGVKDKGILSF